MCHSSQEDVLDLQVPGDHDTVSSQSVQRGEEHPADSFVEPKRDCFGDYAESLCCKNNPSIPHKDFLKSKK